MAVQEGKETEHGKELAKWNLPKRSGGYGADGYEPFPRMLYQAWKRHDGKILVVDETESRRGWKLAKTEDEFDRLRADGWYLTVEEARKAFDAQELAMVQEATRVAYRASTMNEKARAEFDALDQASTSHVLDVPAPKKRRPYQRKKAPIVAAE